MRRYFKLYFTYAKLSLMGKFAYKANLILGVIAFLITQVFAILTLFLLIRNVPSIEGYDMYQIGLLYGITNLAVGIDHLFTDRLWSIAYFEVRRGKVDHLFLRPVPVLFQVIASEIQLEALGELLTGIALIIVCSLNVTITPTFGGIFLVILGIICSVIIISSFKVITSSISFIVKRSGPLLQFVYNFLTYVKYPIKIYPVFIRYILLFVIPLGLALSVPFDQLFNPVYPWYYVALIMVALTAIFAVIAVVVWKACEKRYESTGT